MKWSQEADEKVCSAVLSGIFGDSFASKIASRYGFTVGAVKMRASNYKYLISGGKEGLSNYCKQELEVYNKLK